MSGTYRESTRDGAGCIQYWREDCGLPAIRNHDAQSRKINRDDENIEACNYDILHLQPDKNKLLSAGFKITRERGSIRYSTSLCKMRHKPLRISLFPE